MATEPQGTDTSSTSYTPGAGELAIAFCAPLWGFADQRSYALRPAARDGIWWLQSTGDDATTFVVADPFVVDAGYVVDLGEKERRTLGIDAPEDALALVMLALPTAQGGTVTGNFRAPIVINIRTHVAMQVVSRDEAHAMQRPMALGSYPLRADADSPSA
ncbi:flagellar assembly protein FliW [Gemmatimonas sp.]|jgi:flagellar assembly factor FliW|uniref:flagellar assembly protein FliW n=1 Tax=Gemmatimonas sp. TaxID=1962908 RepID=UPI0037BF6539